MGADETETPKGEKKEAITKREHEHIYCSSELKRATV